MFHFQQNFLMNFGYLPKSDIETGNLRTEDQLKEAIRSLQRFGHIPATGLIDDATRELMLRPRCGQPDNADSNDFSATNRLRIHGRRSKRFVIQGPKWPTTSVTWRLVQSTYYIVYKSQLILFSLLHNIFDKDTPILFNV